MNDHPYDNSFCQVKEKVVKHKLLNFEQKNTNTDMQ